MFKISSVDPDSLWETERIMKEVYDEHPEHWPNGLSRKHFDGGLWLVREKQSNVPAAFVGWQERYEPDNQYPFFKKIGYYSVGTRKKYRRNGFAREAVSKIIQMKSAGVDKVRALIMSTNTPSQELAKDLGVDMEIKQANALRKIWSGLTRNFVSPVRGGILGKEIRDIARKGVTLHSDTGNYAEYLMDNPGRMPGFLNKLFPDTGRQGADWEHRIYSRINRAPGMYLTNESPASQIRRAKGLLFSPTSTLDPKELARIQSVKSMPYWQPAPTPFGEDKWLEAQALREFMPKTELLSNLVSGPVSTAGDYRNLLNQFRQLMGSNWIVKPRFGLASDPGDLITESNLAGLRKVLSGRKGLQDYIIQERRPLKAIPWWQQRIDKLLGEGSNFNRDTREVRVHLLNGRVVPYASTERGSNFGASQSLLSPWRNRYVRHAEELAEQMGSQLPEGLRKNTLYGLDVGFDRSGRPFLIESNPSSPGGYASGILDMPEGIDAVTAAIQGRLPAHVKLRNTLYGTGALGAGGMAYGLGRKKEASSREQSPYIGAAQLAGAGLAADTARSSVKALNLANRLEDFHHGLLDNPREFKDPLASIRALDQYSQLAGEASRLRLLGIPSGHWMSMFPPSKFYDDSDFAGNAWRHATGGSMSSRSQRSWDLAKRHYKGFTTDPSKTLAQEILEYPGAAKAYGSDVGSIMGGASGRSLLDRFSNVLDRYYAAPGAIRNRLGEPINRMARELFLNSQRPGSSAFNRATALGFGPNIYSNLVIRPLAKAILPVSGLLGAYLGYKGLHNLTQ